MLNRHAKPLYNSFAWRSTFAPLTFFFLYYNVHHLSRHVDGLNAGR